MSRLLALAALVLLALCYGGLLLAPDLSIHQARDPVEPALAGNWRGAFGHKNAAAAVMAMVVLVGISVFRAGGRLAGVAVVGLAGLFLAGAEGKSALALVVVVLALTALFRVVRTLRGRALVALGPVALMNLLGVGTVVSDALAALLALLPVDSTFTGRSAIWRFAVEAVAAKPVTGYGFSAFWGTQTLRDVSDEGGSWAGYASHSHNGYLDTTLSLGAVGLVLILLVLVVAPLRAYQSLDAQGRAGPLPTLFLQIWLFGLLLGAMESFFFDRADPIWFTFLLAVFGLHYLARFRGR